MVFNSIPNQAMEHSMDALWLKMRVIGDNITNSETPGYKAKQVSFGEVMKSVGGEAEKKRLVFETKITKDESTSARVDGNNVVMEKEQLELWRTQAQYTMLSQKITGTYANVRNIINTMSR